MLLEVLQAASITEVRKKAARNVFIFNSFRIINNIYTANLMPGLMRIQVLTDFNLMLFFDKVDALFGKRTNVLYIRIS